MKKQMEASFLFRSTDVFYPQGSLSSTQDYPNLQKAQRAAIQRDLSKYISGLETTHKKMARAFKENLKPSVSMKLELLDERLPWTSVDAQGTLRLDVKVVQAVFRASLVDGLNEVTLLGNSARWNTPSEDSSTNVASADQRRVNEFLKLKAEVRAAKGRTAIGTVLHDLRDDDWSEKGWFRMVNLVSRSQPVESHFYGTLLFLFAHEMGHLAMDHLTNHVDADVTGDDCERLLAREYEADQYALVLLVATFPELFGLQSVFGGFANTVLGGHGAFGFETFFKYAYDLAGYDAYAKASGCQHPSKEQRLQRLKEFYAAMEKKSEEAFLERASKEHKRKNDR